MSYLSLLKYGSIFVIFLALAGMILGGVHYFKKSEQLAIENQQLTLQAEAQKIENAKVMAVVVSEKDGAIKRASTIAKQLEVLKHAKANPADDSLINAARWVHEQPDPYSQIQTTGRIDTGHTSTCSGVLNQVTIAEYLTNQFAALEDCRGKLFSLRELSKD